MTRLPDGVSPGAVPSPNIWDHPAVYETENRAFDRDGLVPAAMLRLLDRPGHGWAGLDVLDAGCGTGFHLPDFAGTRSLIGLDPHPALLRLARRRVDRTATLRSSDVRLVQGSVTDLPLPDASVDVVHVRWAYFFGPGSEAGLAEVDRVLRPGGLALVLDNDATRSTFGRWFARAYPGVDPDAVHAFWARHGWHREPVLTSWRFERAGDLADVLRIELDAASADLALAEHRAAGGGLEVDYAVDLWWRRA